MSKLMLHCGGVPASFEEICAVDPPNNTNTYRAVPHGDIVRFLKDRVTKDLGLTPTPQEQYGLNRDGQQMFGTLTYDVIGTPGFDATAFLPEQFQTDSLVRTQKDHGFSLAFRNSYDKSMSIGLAAGTKCFNCDNLSLHGNWFRMLKRHTPKVWDALLLMTMKAIEECAEGYMTMLNYLDHMKHATMHNDDGYRLIGLARGQGVLTPTQETTVVNEWRKTNRDDNHTFHEWRNTAFSLYQAFTEGLKGGVVTRKVDQYTGVSSLFEREGLIQNRLAPVQPVEQPEDAIIVHEERRHELDVNF